MALSEQRRHRMYRRLEKVLGKEAAGTLIEHLPRATWADVPTKAELLATKKDLEDKIRQSEERMSDRFEKILAEKLNAQTRTLVVFMAGLFAGFGTLVLAAVRLG